MVMRVTVEGELGMGKLLSEGLRRQGKHCSHSSPWQVQVPAASHPPRQVHLSLCTHSRVSVESLRMLMPHTGSIGHVGPLTSLYFQAQRF